jgi:UDP-N-acetyl-2-amino-2-deoxyglucuronate dehydrogenase
MNVGILGTGAIANKHAQAYRNIGYPLVACAGLDPARAANFAARWNCEPVSQWRDLCRRPDLDFVDVCTFPNVRLEPVQLCAAAGKHVQVQKPIATTMEAARSMLETAGRAGIVLSVVSQHRFDDAFLFLKRAIDAGRLGKILQADAYVKWHRSTEYYARPVKGTWATEGGGALITQAIHQVDLLLWLAGPVRRVAGEWQIGAAHNIESEDILSAILRYSSGATGVIQAATAFAPGMPERIEIHGTKGAAVITGDRLTSWEVPADGLEPPPLAGAAASGASDPMAISLTPFERQFLDFGDAIKQHRTPLCSGEAGYRALQLTDAIYRSCREGRFIELD